MLRQSFSLTGTTRPGRACPIIPTGVAASGMIVAEPRYHAGSKALRPLPGGSAPGSEMAPLRHFNSTQRTRLRPGFQHERMRLPASGVGSAWLTSAVSFFPATADSIGSFPSLATWGSHGHKSSRATTHCGRVIRADDLGIDYVGGRKDPYLTLKTPALRHTTSAPAPKKTLAAQDYPTRR